MFSMTLNPVDLEAASKIELPAPWTDLQNKDFHPDLVIRAQAYLAWCEREGYEEQANDLLAILGEGFAKPFDADSLRPSQDDPDAKLKNKVLDGFAELATKYGNRVSSVVWQSLAYIAVRTEPERERSILQEAAYLPFHYSVVDTMLHATGKVYTFMLDVHAKIWKHSGHVLIHNCDCGCSLINMQPHAGRIEFDLPAADMEAATYSLLSHMLSESVLIRGLHLPFALGVSPEAAEILALQH